MHMRIYKILNICQGIYNKFVDLETLLRALADRTRLRLLNLLRDQEICVCFLVEALRTSQPKISRHLANLRNSGLVSARREGLWMHYHIVPPETPAERKVLQQVLASLESDPQMQKDFERMEKACCAPQKFVRLESPPVPRKV
jgi:ArsR family transcriptional regulator